MANFKWNPASGKYEEQAPSPSVPSPASSVPAETQRPVPAKVDVPAQSEPKSPTGTPYSVGGKPTAYTGVTTPEGVTNPYTGGMETASPKGTLVGVNQGVYSPENKQKAWERAGGTGSYNPDAFYRGAAGELSLKDGFIQPKPAGAAGTAGTQPPVTGAAPTETPAGAPAIPGIPGTPGTGAPKVVTGDAKTDAELAKLKEEELLKRRQTMDAYALYQGEVEKNKGYYTNFEEVNSRYKNVMNDIRSTLESTGQTVLTDEQAQAIAGKYGLGLSDVKQPLNIFNALNTTDEGKRVLGETKFNQGLDAMKTNYERQKADLQRNIAITSQNVNDQLQDVATQMQRNVDFMKASGAWSGAQRSSAYQAGIENVRNDALNVARKLGEQMKNAHAANATAIARLGEDFNKNTANAKAEFDAQMKDLKHNQALALSGLEEKYGSGNKTLTQALDAITEEFAGKSVEVYTKYVNAQKAAVEVTNSKIEQVKKLNDLTDSIANKRFDEYVANNGALLMNASMTNILAEVKSGQMSVQRAEDLKNVMSSSVINTLSKLGSVTESDVNAVEAMLDAGKTPTQIVAAMKSLPNFKQKVISQVYDLGNGTKRVQYADGTTEDVESATGKTVTVPYGSALYDTRTGRWISNDGTVGTGTGASGTVSSGTDLRASASKYPNEASLKNNNPAGITFNETFAQTLKNAGIQFEKGTARPANEGGNYFSFPNIQEGMKAYQLLWSSPKYQNLTVGQALARWGTDSVPGVDNGKKVSELTAQEFSKLQIAQLRKESPGMLKELTALGWVTPEGLSVPAVSARTSAGFDPNKASLYEKYLSDKATLPPGMKLGMPQAEQFVAEAGAYEKSKASKQSAKKEYTTEQLALLQGIDALNPTTRASLAEAGLDATDWAMMNDGQLPPTKKQVTTAENITKEIDSLLTHDGLEDAVGFKGIQSGYTMPGSDKASYEAMFKKFQNSLALPNLGQLKGPMSDKDVEFIRSASSGLDMDMGEEEFKKTLNEIKRRYQMILDKAAGRSTMSGQNPQSGQPESATGAGSVTTPSGIRFTITK